MEEISIQIFPIPALKDNYIWAVTDMQHQHCLIVDPGEAEPVLEFFQKTLLQPTAILITHKHWDHCNGIVELTQKFPIPVIAPSDVPGSTQIVQDNAMLSIENFFLEVLAIPGHTLEHVAYYGYGAVFCGDTLFTAGCGRVFEGTFAQMYHSLQRLAQLPDETLVYCGHEYTQANLRFAQSVTPDNPLILQRIKKVEALRAQSLPTVPATLAEEKATNPFLRCEAKDILHAVEKRMGKKYSDPIQVFAALRQWKDNFS